MEGLADMFTNLDPTRFTWKREPVLYVTLIVAVLQVVASALQGDLAWVDAVESVVLLVFGFVARGQVTPVGSRDVWVGRSQGFVPFTLEVEEDEGS